MEIGVEEIKQWLQQLSQTLQNKKEYLTDLDQAIGDGDHGLNMARGFKEVSVKIENTSYTDLGLIFKDTGMTLLTKVGGASGPLYGTAFIKCATVLTGKVTMNVSELTDALEAALNGIQARGKANLFDKTMIDVWEPVVSYLKDHKDSVDWEDVMRLSNEKMEATKDLEAKKGRASYLGKRSIGFIDPGATSSAYFFTELSKVLKGVSK
ncbi:MAG: dihydroxyacetone kinase subunit DhaL [Bacillota bacterium]|nr:dihydroxyacetone kinase subunit DhaL [Bacillota bacterium]